MHPLIEENKQQLFAICKKHFVKSLYAFGSITRPDFKDESDLDFLYEIDLENFKDWATGSFDYTDNIMGFEKELKELFKREIDLIPNIHFQNRFFKKTIEETKVQLYAA